MLTSTRLSSLTGGSQWQLILGMPPGVGLRPYYMMLDHVTPEPSCAKLERLGILQLPVISSCEVLTQRLLILIQNNKDIRAMFLIKSNTTSPFNQHSTD